MTFLPGQSLPTHLFTSLEPIYPFHAPKCSCCLGRKWGWISLEIDARRLHRPRKRQWQPCIETNFCPVFFFVWGWRTYFEPLDSSLRGVSGFGRIEGTALLFCPPTFRWALTYASEYDSNDYIHISILIMSKIWTVWIPKRWPSGLLSLKRNHISFKTRIDFALLFSKYSTLGIPTRTWEFFHTRCRTLLGNVYLWSVHFLSVVEVFYLHLGIFEIAKWWNIFHICPGPKITTKNNYLDIYLAKYNLHVKSQWCSKDGKIEFLKGQNCPQLWSREGSSRERKK